MNVLIIARIYGAIIIIIFVPMRIPYDQKCLCCLKAGSSAEELFVLEYVYDPFPGSFFGAQLT